MEAWQQLHAQMSANIFFSSSLRNLTTNSTTHFIIKQTVCVDTSLLVCSMLSILIHHRGRPPMSLCKQSPRAPGHLSPCPSHATAAAALSNQNTTTTTRKSQQLTTAAAAAAAAAAAGLSLKANHHHGSYLPGHAQPPTDIFSHVWCESDQNDGGGSVIPALFLSPLSHQSLLPPLRLLT